MHIRRDCLDAEGRYVNPDNYQPIARLPADNHITSDRQFELKAPAITDFVKSRCDEAATKGCDRANSSYRYEFHRFDDQAGTAERHAVRAGDDQCQGGQSGGYAGEHRRGADEPCQSPACWRKSARVKLQGTDAAGLGLEEDSEEAERCYCAR